MKPVHDSRRRPQRGFTLIEVMIVVAIVGILAAIALPSYTDYLRRGRVQEAVNTLAATRTLMEQYYQDNRSYANGGNCGATAATTANFTFTCATGNAGQSYSISAAGNGGLVTGLTYFIDQLNNQSTTCSSCAWAFSGTQTTWIVRKP